jgi:hypothetical protein
VTLRVGLRRLPGRGKWCLAELADAARTDDGVLVAKRNKLVRCLRAVNWLGKQRHALYFERVCPARPVSQSGAAASAEGEGSAAGRTQDG